MKGAEVVVGAVEEAGAETTGAEEAGAEEAGAEEAGADEAGVETAGADEAGAEVEAAEDEVATLATEVASTALTAGLAEAVVVVLPLKVAQANDILETGVPLSLGALKSHVMATYGQQTLSVPMVTMSPLTNASVETVAEPTFAPLESMTWKDVPA